MSECPVARRTTEEQPANRGDLTVEKPVFLFDTSKSRTETPEYYKAAFPCRKLKAIRPVPTLCNQCARRAELGVRLEAAGTPGTSSDSSSTAGSSVGLAAGGSGSLSDLTNDSGMSASEGTFTVRSVRRVEKDM